MHKPSPLRNPHMILVLVMLYRLSSFHLSLSPFLLLAAHLESWMFSIVIGLTAQGLSLYSPFWSPVIGRKPINGIYLLSHVSSLVILLDTDYISVVTMSRPKTRSKGVTVISHLKPEGLKYNLTQTIIL